MTSAASAADDDGGVALSIGQLSRRTGVSTATLRAWETRHGFPRSHRLASGHRRYSPDDLADIAEVVRRRASGTRLDVALDQVRSARDHTRDARAASTGSIHAQLREQHPGMTPHRLHKRTLLALSWAIEDEFCAKANRAVLFGSFQEPRHWHRARARWTDLARTAAAVHVFGVFDPAEASTDRIRLVPLPEDSPMRREWTVVCDAPSLPAALTAWELPGQSEVPDHQRVFESTWTFDPQRVRDAARLCLQLATSLGEPESSFAPALDARPDSSVVDVNAVTAMFERTVDYLDISVARAEG